MLSRHNYRERWTRWSESARPRRTGWLPFKRRTPSRGRSAPKGRGSDKGRGCAVLVIRAYTNSCWVWTKKIVTVFTRTDTTGGCHHWTQKLMFNILHPRNFCNIEKKRQIFVLYPTAWRTVGFCCYEHWLVVSFIIRRHHVNKGRVMQFRLNSLSWICRRCKRSEVLVAVFQDATP